MFDVATEAEDGVHLCCILLQVCTACEWLETGIAGLGIALRAQVEPSG